MNIIKKTAKFDFSLIFCMTGIFLIGIFNLYSITSSQSNAYLVSYQIIWFGLALSIALIFSFMNPSNFHRYSYWIFSVNVFLLVLVLVLGKVGMGAQRWIGLGPIRIQPSEFMKLSLIFALARWFSERSPDKTITLKETLLPLGFVFPPMFLIYKQPDLGTSLILLIIFSFIIFYRRLSWKSIFKIAGVTLAASILMYSFLLKDYQKRRILTFINPYEDAKDAGYNAIQSEIAIGSGLFWGKGFKKSSQASLNFLPEKHTDFVFSIFSEEHGFFGSVILIILFALLFYRLISIAKDATRIYDSIFIIGVIAVFFAHIFVNIAMVSGVLPIVGLPLPFMSYGGSSLLLFGMCIGLVNSISNSRTIF